MDAALVSVGQALSGDMAVLAARSEAFADVLKSMYPDFQVLVAISGLASILGLRTDSILDEACRLENEIHVKERVCALESLYNEISTVLSPLYGFMSSGILDRIQLDTHARILRMCEEESKSEKEIQQVCAFRIQGLCIHHCISSGLSSRWQQEEPYSTFLRNAFEKYSEMTLKLCHLFSRSDRIVMVANSVLLLHHSKLFIDPTSISNLEYTHAFVFPKFNRFLAVILKDFAVKVSAHNQLLEIQKSASCESHDVASITFSALQQIDYPFPEDFSFSDYSNKSYSVPLLRHEELLRISCFFKTSIQICSLLFHCYLDTELQKIGFISEEQFEFTSFSKECCLFASRLLCKEEIALLSSDFDSSIHTLSDPQRFFAAVSYSCAMIKASMSKSDIVYAIQLFSRRLFLKFLHSLLKTVETSLNCIAPKSCPAFRGLDFRILGTSDMGFCDFLRPLNVFIVASDSSKLQEKFHDYMFSLMFCASIICSSLGSSKSIRSCWDSSLQSFSVVQQLQWNEFGVDFSRLVQTRCFPNVFLRNSISESSELCFDAASDSLFSNEQSEPKLSISVFLESDHAFSTRKTRKFSFLFQELSLAIERLEEFSILRPGDCNKEIESCRCIIIDVLHFIFYCINAQPREQLYSSVKGRYLKSLIEAGSVPSQLGKRLSDFLEDAWLNRVLSSTSDEIVHQFMQLDRHIHLCMNPLKRLVLSIFQSKSLNCIKDTQMIFSSNLSFAQGDFEQSLSKHLKARDPMTEENSSKAQMILSHSGKISIKRDVQNLLENLFEGSGKKSKPRRERDLFSLTTNLCAAQLKQCSLYTVSPVHLIRFCPSTPGNECCLSVLFHLLFGDISRAIPLSEFGRIEVNSKTLKLCVPINLYKIEVEKLRSSFIPEVEPTPHWNLDFSALFIFFVLSRFEYLDQRSMFVTSDSRIICSRLEKCFAKPVSSGIFNASPKPGIKNFLFCLPQMFNPLHPEIRSRLLLLDPFQFVETWLLSIQVMDAEMRSSLLFAEEELQVLFDSLDESSFVIGERSRSIGCCVPVFLNPNVVLEILNSLLLIQNELKLHPALTHMEILSLCFPDLAQIYLEEIRTNVLFTAKTEKRADTLAYSPETVFNRIIDGKLESGKKVKVDASILLSNAVDHFKSLQHEDKSIKWSAKFHSKPLNVHSSLWDLVSPSAMLKLFSSLLNEPKCFAALSSRTSFDVDQFKSLRIPFFREKFLFQNSPRFSKSQFDSFLLSASLSLDIRKLNLKGSHAFETSLFKICLARFPLLVSLNVSFCPFIEGNSLFSVVSSNCPYLRELFAEGLSSVTTLSNHSWTRIGNVLAPELRTLYVGECVSLSIVDFELSQLNILSVASNKGHSIRTLRSVIAPSLSELYLDGWNNVGAVHDDFDLLPVLSNLQILSLRKCANLKAFVFKSFSSMLPRLEKLFLDECPELQTVSIFTLARLKSFSAYGCVSLNELGVCPVTLEECNLDGCSSLDLRTLCRFLQGAVNLRSISLRECSALDPEVCEEIENDVWKWLLLMIFDFNAQFDFLKRIPALSCLRSQQKIRSDLKSTPQFSFLNDSVENNLEISTLQDLYLLVLELLCCKDSNLFRRITSLNFNALEKSRNLVLDSLLIAILCRADRLEKLDLEGCSKLTKSSIDALVNSRNLQNLSFLNLSWCSLLDDDSLLNLFFSRLPKLKNLFLTGLTKISDISLNRIGISCSNLELVSLRYCSNLSDAAMITLIKSCVNLKYLDMSHCSSITDNSMLVLKDCCSKLRTLKIANCLGISDVGFASVGSGASAYQLSVLDISDNFHWKPSFSHDFWKALKTLNHFDMENCSLVSPQVLALILKRNKNLRHLNLRGCSKVDDRLLVHISKKCLELRTLLLSETQLIADEGLQYIFLSCHNLKCLSLMNCSCVTGSSLMLASSACPKLESLQVHRCALITDAAIKRFSWIRPEVTIYSWCIVLNSSLCAA